jgi:peroxiredoxin
MWPHERSLVNDLKDKPFALLGVNIVDHQPGKLAEVMDREQLPWRSFADQGPTSRGVIAKAWNHTATPTLFLIDDLGVIRHKWVGRAPPEVVDAAIGKCLEAAARR